MYKLILPTVGVIMNILLYSLLPYNGEFALLLIVGILIGAVMGFILGFIAPDTGAGSS